MAAKVTRTARKRVRTAARAGLKTVRGRDPLVMVRFPGSPPLFERQRVAAALARRFVACSTARIRRAAYCADPERGL